MGVALKGGGKPVEASGIPLDVSFHDDQDGGKKFEFLSETLRFRSQKTPEHVLFSLLDSKAHMFPATPEEICRVYRGELWR